MHHAFSSADLTTTDGESVLPSLKFRPDLARIATDQILDYYISPDADIGLPYTGRGNSQLYTDANLPPFLQSSSQPFSASSQSESPSPPSPQSTRRARLPSLASQDNRRLAIVELDASTPMDVDTDPSQYTFANVHDGSVPSGHDALLLGGVEKESTLAGQPSPSNLLARRGLDHARLALVAPPDASPASYTNLSPPEHPDSPLQAPLSAPLRRQKYADSDYYGDESEAPSSRDHRRTRSHILDHGAAKDRDRLGHGINAGRRVAGRTSPRDGMVFFPPGDYTQVAQTPWKRAQASADNQKPRYPDANKSSTATASTPLRTLPVSSASPPSESVAPRSSPKKPNHPPLPTPEPIVTPAIGQEKDPMTRVAGPVVIGLGEISLPLSNTIAHERTRSSGNSHSQEPIPTVMRVMTASSTSATPPLPVPRTDASLRPSSWQSVNGSSSLPPPRPPRAHQARKNLSASVSASSVADATKVPFRPGMQTMDSDFSFAAVSESSSSISEATFGVVPSRSTQSDPSFPSASSQPDRPIGHRREAAQTSPTADRATSPSSPSSGPKRVHLITPPLQEDDDDEPQPQKVAQPVIAYVHPVPHPGTAITQELGAPASSGVPLTRRAALDLTSVVAPGKLDRPIAVAPNSEHDRDVDRRASPPSQSTASLSPVNSKRFSNGSAPSTNGPGAMQRSSSAISSSRFSLQNQRSTLPSHSQENQPPGTHLQVSQPRCRQKRLRGPGSVPEAMGLRDVLSRRSTLDRALGYAAKMRELLEEEDSGLGDWVEWRHRVRKNGGRDVPRARDASVSSGSSVSRMDHSPAGSSRLAEVNGGNHSFNPQPRNVSHGSESSEVTFPIRPDAYTATNLSARTIGDSPPQGPPANLPYPGAGHNILTRSATGVRNFATTLNMNNLNGTAMASSTTLASHSASFRSTKVPPSPKTEGRGFFASISRKASIRKDRPSLPQQPAPASSASGQTPVKIALSTVTSRPNQVGLYQEARSRTLTGPRPQPSKGGPVRHNSLLASFGRRSQEKDKEREAHAAIKDEELGDARSVITAEVESLSIRSDDTTSLHGGAGLLPRSSLSYRGGETDRAGVFKRNLDKVADVLPHVDRTTLALYLKRTGGEDLAAIDLYLQDERRGVIMTVE
ncbi:hypothetical protein FRB99_005937 [Tulasnella sp. 403]|nr:hypothetical protein FRB99_005937 [Tulasnella sp. 403]